MKDKSKKLTVVNTDNRKPAPSGESTTQVVGGGSFGGIPIGGGLDYLLKAIWDKVWEIKTDSQGNEYIFGKLPVVTQYGITMYADGGEIDLPSIYAGIPFDNKTIWLNPETGKVEVIGGTGGGVADSVHWNNIEGKPTFSAVATSGKYADLNGLPDLSVYATTEYLTSELKKYVTIDGNEAINGLKNFTKGLQIDGLGITKSQDDVIYLDANLVVRGGITMFGTNSVDVPTIMDAIATDGVNLKVVDGVLTFVGSSGGGLSEVYWDDVIGKPTLLSSFIDDVGYLQKSGGQMTGSIGYTLTPDSYEVGLSAAGTIDSLAGLDKLNSYKSFLGSVYTDDWYYALSIRHRNGRDDGNKYGLLLYTTFSQSGNLEWNRQENGIWKGNRVILDSVNWSQYVTASDGGSYLPLSGGTLNGPLNLFRPNINNTRTYQFWIDNEGFYLSNGSNLPLLVKGNSIEIGYSDSYLTNLNVHGLIRGTNVSSKSASWGQYLNYSEAVYGIPAITSTGVQPILGWSAYINGRESRYVIGSTTDGELYGDMYISVVNADSPSTGRRLILMSNGRLAWEGYFTANYVMTGQEGYFFNDFQFARFNDYGNLLLKSNYAKMFFRPNAESESGQMTVDTGGNVLVSGGITMYSDIRKKTKLKDVELTLQQIADAPLIEHYYNSDEKRTTHVGSIAQYWASMNDWFCKLDNDGFYTMEIQNAALASAISIARELVKYESKTDRKIRLLKKRIGELEDKIEELEKKGA